MAEGETGRWPNGAKGAISFSMDNLGEAQDVNKGVWPSDKVIGHHFSVEENLPRMLDLLDRHGVKATFFAESWSLEVYPAAVAEMQRRGHEIAWHGYQHEVFKGQSETEEDENFRKSFEAAERAGVAYDGFRPPGGDVNDRTWELLRRHGIKYISPLGELGIREGVVVLPFEWRGVDAFYYMDKFTQIRKSHGESEEVKSAAEFRSFIFDKIEDLKSTGGYTSILFHPFLQTGEDKFAVLDEVLARVAAEEGLWVAPCNEVADWITSHQRLFTGSGSWLDTN
jgi:peptidoglycan/xylan/chitin deacetylase (PgdA/CDA1 family)